MTRLHDAQDAGDVSNISEQLVRDEVLSDKQHQRIGRVLMRVVEVIKETKIGQGLKFVQRTIGPLKKMLHENR